MNFDIEILANLEFLGASNLSKTVHKINTFILISSCNRNRKVGITRFSKQSVQRSQKNSQPINMNGILPLITDFTLNEKFRRSIAFKSQRFDNKIHQNLNNYWFIFVLL